MIAKYSYKAGSARIDQIQNDIHLLITGTSNLNELSSSCDIDNSTILNTTSPEWIYNGTVKSVVYPMASNFITISGVSTFCDAFYSPTFRQWYSINYWASNSAFYIHSSFDGCVITTIAKQAVTTGNTYTPYMADNGTNIAVLHGTASAIRGFYSVDGINFLTSNTFTGILVTAITNHNSTFVAVSSAGTSALYSTNGGINWSTATIPTGNYQAIASNGTTITAIGATGLCSWSTDGITWSQVGVTAPTGGTYLSVVWSGTRFVAIGINISAYSSDGITWNLGTLVNASGGKVLWDATSSLFYVMTGTNSMAVSADGVTWTYRTGLSTNMTSTSKNGAYRAWAIGRHGELQVFQTNSSTSGIVYRFNSACYKALNADGITYKHISLEFIPQYQAQTYGYIGMNSYESVSNGSWTNQSYNPVTIGNDQKLFFSGGGIIYIFATNRYLFLLSYANSLWGSTTNLSAIGCIEYAREDDWNISPYPCWAVINTTPTTIYSPRLKSQNAVDVTSVSSFLTESPDYIINKSIIDRLGNTFHTDREIRVCNPTSYTNLVLGGKVLGDIRRTTDSLGLNLDELVFNSVRYITLIFGTNRYLIPKT